VVENVKTINNPLTIIAIFAALAEVAGTVALGLVEKELQITFIWFVMLFPALLVLLFFLTLNFNPKVLYAPSDFKSDESFLRVNRLSDSFDEVQKQLDDAKSQMLEATVKSIGIANETERNKLLQIIESKIDAIRNKVEITKESVEEAVVLNTSTIQNNTTKNLVLDLLKKENREMTGAEIIQRLTEAGRSREAIIYNLRNLTKSGYLLRSTETDKKNYIYRITHSGLASIE
jgi:hypothetical protein